MDQLNLNEFPKISTKISFSYSATDKEGAEKWLIGLGGFKISPEFSNAFGGKTDSAVAAFTFVGEDRLFRVQFGIAEKQAQIDRGVAQVSIRLASLTQGQNKAFKQKLLQKRSGVSEPIYVSLIEIESYQEFPPSIDSGDFVRTSIDQSARRLASATNA